MSSRLSGKSALITGSTSGIGEAIAQAMAAEGARVVVTGRDRARGADVIAAITAAGGQASFVAADLGGGCAAIEQLAADAVAAAGGQIDVLVNNAAYLLGGKSTLDTDEALIDAALGVSVRAPFLLTRAIVPAMLTRGNGIIVNIGSINGTVGMNGAALYGATKAALHSLTKSWAAEFGPQGIRVNTVAPGPTLTAHNESIREYLDDMLSTVPSRRMSTTAEVAAAAVFLSSDDASNIHGATLPVDGGFTSR